MTPILEARGVEKWFGGVCALAGVSVALHPAEILGVIGPNGSGKSTLIHILTGHHAPNRGRVLYQGQDITGLAPHRVAELGIARTYQIPRPFGSLRTGENVGMGLLFGARESRLKNPRAMAEAVGSWAEFVGLREWVEHPVTALTLQQRRLLELARALATRPRAILIDEVLAGLNAEEVHRVLHVIRSIRGQGIAVLLVEHNVHAIRAVADRVVVLDQGTVIAEGNPQQVLQDARVIRAYLGEPRA